MELKEYQAQATQPLFIPVIDHMKELATLLRYVTRQAKMHGFSLEELASLDMENHGRQ